MGPSGQYTPFDQCVSRWQPKYYLGRCCVDSRIRNWVGSCRSSQVSVRTEFQYASVLIVISDIFGRRWFFFGSSALAVLGNIIGASAQSVNQVSSV